MKHTAYLIVDSRGGMRIRKSRPYAREVGANEVYFKIVVDVPEVRGAIGEFLLTVPPMPDVGVEVDQEVYDALIPVKPEADGPQG